MRTVVEGMLPQQFLLDLGVYMQTAAHIELAVWQTTMHAEGIDPYSAEEYRDYVELKLSTSELLKRFRKCATGCPQIVADRISSVADEVAKGLETRNLAAHGAFFIEDDAQGILGAAHYFGRGTRKTRELFEVKQTVNRQVVEDALKVADQLLHDVIVLRAMVIDWRYPNGMPELSEMPVNAEDQSSADQTALGDSLTS
jgi:hypothetical protein